MGMVRLSFHYKGVADFPSDDQQHHIVTLDIIQYAEITGAHFVTRQGVGAQLLDCPGVGVVG